MEKTVLFSDVIASMYEEGWSTEKILTEGFKLFDLIRDTLKKCGNKDDFVILLIEDLTILDELSEYRTIDEDVFRILEENGFKDVTKYQFLLKIVEVLLTIRNKYDNKQKHIFSIIENDKELQQLLDERKLTEEFALKSILLNLTSQYLGFQEIHQLLKEYGFRCNEKMNPKLDVIKEQRDELKLITLLLDDFIKLM